MKEYVLNEHQIKIIEKLNSMANKQNKIVVSFPAKYFKPEKNEKSKA